MNWNSQDTYIIFTEECTIIFGLSFVIIILLSPPVVLALEDKLLWAGSLSVDAVSPEHICHSMSIISNEGWH